MAERFRPLGLYVWALGAAGFGAGYALIALWARYHQFKRHVVSQTQLILFTHTSQFHVWAALVGAQTALWVALMPGLWGHLVELRTSAPDRGRDRRVFHIYLVFSALVLISGGIILRLLKPVPPVHGFEVRIAVLTLIGLVTVAPAAMIMWTILVILEGVRNQMHEAGDRRLEESPAAIGTLAGQIEYLRRVLKLVVGQVGAVIGSIALSTGALHNAVDAWNAMAFPWSNSPAKGYDFPPEFVLLYAIFFVLLLALVYVPVYLSLERRAREVLDAVYPADWSAEPAADWARRRKELGDYLQVGIRLEESLRAGVAILAPLTGLLLSTFLPGAKL